jgi:hypothetical protein
MVFIEVEQQQLGVADDAGEDVVEIVGHPAGHQADGLHLLVTEQLFLESMAFGDVDGDHARSDDLLRLADRCRPEQNGEGAVLGIDGQEFFKAGIGIA